MIRPYLITDRQRLLKVWEDAVLASHDYLSNEDFLFLQDYMSKAELDDYCLYVHCEDAIVNGFISVDADTIHMLFVSPHFFRHGIGRKLLTFAVLHLDARSVTVNAQNTAALKFYQAMGFVVSGRSNLDGFGKPYPILKLRLDEDQFDFSEQLTPAEISRF